MTNNNKVDRTEELAELYNDNDNASEYTKYKEYTPEKKKTKIEKLEEEVERLSLSQKIKDKQVLLENMRELYTEYAKDENLELHKEKILPLINKGKELASELNLIEKHKNNSNQKPKRKWNNDALYKKAMDNYNAR